MTGKVSVRTGSQAQVRLIPPVLQVMLASQDSPTLFASPIGNLILPETGLCQAIGGKIIHISGQVVIGQRHKSAPRPGLKRRTVLDRQRIQR